MRGYWTRRPLPSFRNSTTSSVSSFILFLSPGPLSRPRPPAPSSLVPCSFVCPRTPSCPVPSLSPPLFFFLLFLPRGLIPCVPSICGVPHLGATQWSHNCSRAVWLALTATGAEARRRRRRRHRTWVLPCGRFQLFGFPTVNWFPLARCGA